MAISMSSIFGVHESALAYQAKRAEVLAANMANADTPGFKARDFDFKSVLKQIDAKSNTGLSTTHAKHIGVNTTPSNLQLGYRVPHSATLDGNTVDSQAEQGRYAQNALDYQASVRFLNGKISSYLSALRGE